jgi:ATP-dependent Clp protease ATP-binding subunit ClpB
LQDAQKLKEQIDQAKLEAEQAQRRGDFQRAGELTLFCHPRPRQEAEGRRAGPAAPRMLNEVVSEEDIARGLR